MKLALRAAVVLALTALLLWFWLRGLELEALGAAVAEASPILSPAYDNPAVTEEGLRKTYLRRYGVTPDSA